jgi:hypothetical protein
MIGHHVTCTVWQVVVSWNAQRKTFAVPDAKVSLESKQRELYVLTATDDGSDVYEVARKQIFSCPDHARQHEFQLVHLRRLFQAEGHALGQFESKVPS